MSIPPVVLHALEVLDSIDAMVRQILAAILPVVCSVIPVVRYILATILSCIRSIGAIVGHAVPTIRAVIGYTFPTIRAVVGHLPDDPSGRLGGCPRGPIGCPPMVRCRPPGDRRVIVPSPAGPKVDCRRPVQQAADSDENQRFAGSLRQHRRLSPGVVSHRRRGRTDVSIQKAG